MHDRIDLINYLRTSKRVQVTLYDDTVYEGEVVWLGNNWFKINEGICAELEEEIETLVAYSDVKYATRY